MTKSASESEIYLLGAILLKPDCLTEISAELKPDDFSNDRHEMIFETMLKISRSGGLIDTLSVFNAMGRTDDLSFLRWLETDGKRYLMDIADNATTSAAIPYHIGQVKEARARNDIQDLLADTRKQVKDGQPASDVLSGLRESVQKMTIGGYLGLDPFEPLTKHISDKYDRDGERDPDNPLGYRLRKFSRLSKNIDGIQPGFYVVGAETNAGKTAFLCNLTLDLLNSNQDLAGIYFSLDDSRDIILNRFLSILSSIPLNQVQRPQHNERHNEMRIDGYGRLKDLAESNRLFIRDASEIQDVSDLENEIRRRLKGPLFVVIDALYNLDIGGDTLDQRKENIERANRLKSIATTFDLPVITTGELRKSKDRREKNKPPIIDDLMETGKFAYNANLVLLLYPESWEAYDTENEPVLIMRYAKNKLSHYRGKDRLRFKRKYSAMSEETGI